MSETDPTGAAPARPPVAGESDVTFPRLTEAQMATIEAAGRREQVSAGQILCSPGDLDMVDYAESISGAADQDSKINKLQQGE